MSGTSLTFSSVDTGGPRLQQSPQRWRRSPSRQPAISLTAASRPLSTPHCKRDPRIKTSNLMQISFSTPYGRGLLTSLVIPRVWQMSRARNIVAQCSALSPDIGTQRIVPTHIIALVESRIRYTIGVSAARRRTTPKLVCCTQGEKSSPGLLRGCSSDEDWSESETLYVF